jgi:hypothetical protein
LLGIRRGAPRFREDVCAYHRHADRVPADRAANRQAVFVLETVQRRSIDVAAASAERPDLSAFLRFSLERFKSHLRTISNSRFRIILIWTYSNIPSP